MNISNLLYYILKLIVEGQKWQYQNATRTNKHPRTYFTTLQWIAILLALIFVLTNSSGLNSNTIDLLLSSLSIMVGLFLALIVVVYDKFKELSFCADTEEEKINKLKSWNSLRQFNALISYAIFIALIVISMLIGSILYGHQIDFSNIYLTESIKDVDIYLSIKVTFVIIVRFSLVYFLLDFLILTIHAVSSLFQFINIEMLSKKPPYKLNGSKVLSDMETLKMEFPKLACIAKFLMWLSIIGIVVYELEFILLVIRKYF